MIIVIDILVVNNYLSEEVGWIEVQSYCFNIICDC
jgi:hypothetical protein